MPKNSKDDHWNLLASELGFTPPDPEPSQDPEVLGQDTDPGADEQPQGDDVASSAPESISAETDSTLDEQVEGQSPEATGSAPSEDEPSETASRPSSVCQRTFEAEPVDLPGLPWGTSFAPPKKQDAQEPVVQEPAAEEPAAEETPIKETASVAPPAKEKSPFGEGLLVADEPDSAQDDSREPDQPIADEEMASPAGPGDEDEAEPKEVKKGRGKRRRGRRKRPASDRQAPQEEQEEAAEPVEAAGEDAVKPVEDAVEPISAESEELAETDSSAPAEVPEGRPKRKRRGGARRKSKRGPKPTEEATANVADNETDPSNVEYEESVAPEEADSTQPDREKQKTDGAEPAPKPGHRNIPTWAEAIDSIISVNMEGRARRPNSGSSPRGRGGRGGRGKGSGSRSRKSGS